MTAYDEMKRGQDEWDNHIRSLRIRGINPFPANLTTQYDKDGVETKQGTEKNNHVCER